MTTCIYVSLDGRLTALDRATGNARWQQILPTGPNQMVHYRDKIYVVVAGGNDFLVLNAHTGAIEQRARFTGSGQSPTLLADNDTVFVTSGGEVHAYELDGTLRWSNTLPGMGHGFMNIATETSDRQAGYYY